MINYYGYQSNENSENEGNSVTRKSKHNFRLDNPADADTPDRHMSPEYSNMIGYKMMKNLSYNKQAFLANNSQHLGDSPENEWNTSGEEHIYYDRVAIKESKGRNKLGLRSNETSLEPKIISVDLDESLNHTPTADSRTNPPNFTSWDQNESVQKQPKKYLKKVNRMLENEALMRSGDYKIASEVFENITSLDQTQKYSNRGALSPSNYNRSAYFSPEGNKSGYYTNKHSTQNTSKYSHKPPVAKAERQTERIPSKRGNITYLNQEIRHKSPCMARIEPSICSQNYTNIRHTTKNADAKMSDKRKEYTIHVEAPLDFDDLVVQDKQLVDLRRTKSTRKTIKPTKSTADFKNTNIYTSNGLSLTSLNNPTLNRDNSDNAILRIEKKLSNMLEKREDDDSQSFSDAAPASISSVYENKKQLNKYHRNVLYNEKSVKHHKSMMVEEKSPRSQLKQNIMRGKNSTKEVINRASNQKPVYQSSNVPVSSQSNFYQNVRKTSNFSQKLHAASNECNKSSFSKNSTKYVDREGF